MTAPEPDTAESGAVPAGAALSGRASRGPSASRYTHGHEAATLASHSRRTALTSCGYLLPHLRAGMSVLDVGCGPGSVTLDLAERVAPGMVTGIEPVPAPLETARRAAASRADRRTRFELADVYRLPYADGSFDVVHAHQVLQHLADPVAALREMHRVCTPGGLLAVRDADYSGMFWYPPSPALEDWRQTYSSIARVNAGEPDAGRRLRHWARRAGLEDIRTSVSVWQYATPEETAWWGGSQADRVSGHEFLRQAEELGIGPERVRAMAEGWRAWGRDPDAVFVMPHGELLARVGRGSEAAGGEGAGADVG